MFQWLPVRYKTDQERFARKKHSGLFAGNKSDEEEKV
jgi:hypothetical protein